MPSLKRSFSDMSTTPVTVTSSAYATAVDLLDNISHEVLKDIIKHLLGSSVTQSHAHEVVMSKQAEHGFTVEKQAQFIIDQLLDKREEFDPFSDQDCEKLYPVLVKASQWLAAERYEDASSWHGLVLNVSSGEHKGNDPLPWEDWERQLDIIFLQIAEKFYMTDWTFSDLVQKIQAMEAVRKDADDFGYTAFEQSLPKFKSLLKACDTNQQSPDVHVIVLE